MSIMFPVPTNTQLETIQEDGTLKAVVDGENILLMDMPIELVVIQPGMLQNEKDKDTLKPHVGKIGYAINPGGGQGRSWLGKFEEAPRLIPIEEGQIRRTYFDTYKGPGGDNKLLCSSNNNLTPSPRIEAPFSARCTEQKTGQRGDVYYNPVCPKATWVKDPSTGKNAPPPCKEYREVVFFDLDLKCQVTMSIKSTAIKAWNDFKKSIAVEMTKMKFAGKSPAKMYLELTTDNQGTHVVPVFTIKEAEDAPITKYAALIAYYQEAFKAKPVTTTVDQDLDAAGFGMPSDTDRQMAVDVTANLDETPPTQEELNEALGDVRQPEDAFEMA